MTQPTFTLGPWKLDRRFNGIVISGHPHAAWEIVSPSAQTGVAVCILPYEDITDSTSRECSSNAHLIAAAPEMYKALMLVAEAFVLYQEDRGPLGQIVRVALAKADGKESQ